MAQFRHSYSPIFPFRSRSLASLTSIKINNLDRGGMGAGETATYDMYRIQHQLAQIWLYIGGVGLPIRAVMAVVAAQRAPPRAFSLALSAIIREI